MGSRTNFALALVGLMALLAGVVIGINILVFCQGSQELDLRILKIDCGHLPNKQAELDAALERSCHALRAGYGCDTRQAESITLAYAEFGQQPRNYTLLELCSLKNPYSTGTQCARMCGCRI